MSLTARQIRMIRIANGIQQKELAELLGIPQGTWSNVELGNQILYSDVQANAVRILKELGCDFSVLNKEVDYPKWTKVWNEKPNKEAKEVEQPKNDATRPEHYHKGGLDLFGFLELKWSKEQLEAFYAGNVLKYVLRYKDKNGLEDLQKAKVYLDKLIQTHQEE